MTEADEKTRQGRYREVVSFSHFPKAGGIKRFVIEKGDKGLLVRLEQYDKQNSQNNNRVVFSLDESEAGLLALKLLKYLLGGGD